MPVSNAELNALEELLIKGVFAKSKEGASEERLLRQAFKQFDTDGSGEVSYDEFVRALERFGLQVSSELLPGRASGGVRADVMRALFEKYNADGSAELSYTEFAAGLYGGRGRTAAATEASCSSDEGSPQRARQSSAQNGHHARGLSLANPRWRERAGQAADAGANPWLPSLEGAESMDQHYCRPSAETRAVRVRSIANPSQRSSVHASPA